MKFDVNLTSSSFTRRGSMSPPHPPQLLVGFFQVPAPVQIQDRGRGGRGGGEISYFKLWPARTKPHLTYSPVSSLKLMGFFYKCSSFHETMQVWPAVKPELILDFLRAAALYRLLWRVLWKYGEFCSHNSHLTVSSKLYPVSNTIYITFEA